jgi:DNA-binding transcriptional regulator YiaG
MSPEEFRAAREAAGLSQSAFASSIEQFARSIRCSVSKVKHYEQGRAPVPEDVARAVRAIMSDGSETPREKVS